MDTNNVAAAGAFAAIIALFWIFVLAVYLIQAITYYKLAEKANVRNSWLAFIPILQFILFFHIIDKSAWSILLFLIPLVNVILGILWYYEFFKAFGIGTLPIILAIIIPPVGFIMMLYMAFSSSVSYVGSNRFAA